VNLGRPFRLALVGPPGSGKTTALARVAGELVSRSVTVGGVLQPRILDHDRTIGYQLSVMGSPDTRSLLARRRPTGRGFDFDPDVFAAAAREIQRAIRGARIVVVDELGSLEADGRGHLPALMTDTPTSAAVWLLAVREDVEAAIADRLGGLDQVLRPPYSLDVIESAVLTLLG
jgi:nucleoside-triphosphatase THEP1